MMLFNKQETNKNFKLREVMGCAHTKTITDSVNVYKRNSNANNSCETAAAGNGSSPAHPQVDPRLPLTVRQKFNISKSWKGIARAIEPTGVLMFVKLFEENRELLELFVKFESLRTKESLESSVELAEHATLVMNTLNEAISSLDNIDYFIDYLHTIGKLHHRIPGFVKQNFWKIETPFLLAVKEILDERYTENMENIYKIIIKFILETIVAGYELSDPNNASKCETNLNENKTTTDTVTAATSHEIDVTIDAPNVVYKSS